MKFTKTTKNYYAVFFVCIINLSVVSIACNNTKKGFISNDIHEQKLDEEQQFERLKRMFSSQNIKIRRKGLYQTSKSYKANTNNIQFLTIIEEEASSGDDEFSLEALKVLTGIKSSHSKDVFYNSMKATNMIRKVIASYGLSTLHDGVDEHFDEIILSCLHILENSNLNDYVQRQIIAGAEGILNDLSKTLGLEAPKVEVFFAEEISKDDTSAIMDRWSEYVVHMTHWWRTYLNDRNSTPEDVSQN